RALVEDFLEPRLALPAGLAAVGQPAGRPGTGAARRMERLGGARPAAAVGKGLRHAALDDLVELAAVEPDAAALRAIVDLDPLAVAHRQRHAADRAGHGGDFVLGSHASLLSGQ